LPGSTVDITSNNDIKEYSFTYHSAGIADDQYIGNAFNLRQLSLKFRYRVIPVLDGNWSSVNSSNFIAYRLLLIGPKSIAGIANPPIESRFPTSSDMFQDIPQVGISGLPLLIQGQ
jgi:hypothetical protein